MNKIYILYGNNSLCISDRIKEILKELSSNDTRNVFVQRHKLSAAEDLDFLFNSCANLLLFTDDCLLQIDTSIKFLQTANKNSPQLTNFIKSFANYKTIVFVVNVERVDKNTKKQIYDLSVLKELSGSAQIEEFVKLKAWQINDIKAYISQLLKNYDLKFENNALNLFADYVKDDIENLNSELGKLQTYLLPENLVTVNTVKDLYFVSFKIEDLYKSIIQRDYLSSVSFMNQISKSFNSLYLIAVLQNKLRQALKIKSFSDISLNPFQISKLTGINSYFVEKEIISLKKTSSDCLKRIILNISQIELKIKSGVIKESNSLEMILLGSY
ncbi:MAG: hypothetical protein HY094_00900 [Candidatus Melainabacteria bacterium]|nr:hypothetical protein [Candidatus Melainabacteria bacterium]